jgi:hypothetical protein
MPYGTRYGSMLRVTPVWNEKCYAFFGTFARFGEIVRIQVEYRTLRGTQGRAARMYGIGLTGTVSYGTVRYRYRTVRYRYGKEHRDAEIPG